MITFKPEKLFYEKEILDYAQGQELLARYRASGIPLIEIESHNNIPELRNQPDSSFVQLKRYLILGIRKSLRLVPNTRSADYIVPFTSSGCSALCLYCYLVCTFFKNAYLRIFINREEMLNQVKRNASKQTGTKVYEIGSNSDLVLENQITGNLSWAIEEFAHIKHARCTFATKFADVDRLLNLDHNGQTQIRMSINPPEMIRRVEIGTSPLKDRLEAANKMYRAGYKVGLNIAPIILLDNWQEAYITLFEEMHNTLEPELLADTFFELILMTYGLANQTINQAALPRALNVFEKEKMRPKGRGKYCYNAEIHHNASTFFQKELAARFPQATISYIV